MTQFNYDKTKLNFKIKTENVNIKNVWFSYKASLQKTINANYNSLTKTTPVLETRFFLHMSLWVWMSLINWLPIGTNIVLTEWSGTKAGL